jgi:penicillin-binding protein A
MNASIRKVALVIGLVFLALFVNLNVVQVARSTQLSEHPRNQRDLIDERGTKRGAILASDGTVLAQSVPTGDPVDKWRREYPQKSLMGFITGYATSSIFCGSSGVEASYDDYLTGQKPLTTDTFWDELLGREKTGNNLRLTINPSLQRLARKELGSQRGAVAAIDPRTGAILALWSNPNYDPNLITRKIQRGCEDPKRALEADPDRPLRSRATQERYPPGSTFKIITAAAGLADGMRPTTSFPNPGTLDLPDTNLRLRNFGGGSCAGGGGISMAQGLRVSCNTTFAQIAMRIGAKKLDDMARKFGLDVTPDFDIPAVSSCLIALPGGPCDDPSALSRPATAYSGIGQQSVRLTALQMARVVATVANDGRVPRPYVVDRVLDPDNKLLQRTKPQLSKPIYKARVARQLKEMLYDVMRFGTGRAANFNLSLAKIGGKTGTAQTGVDGAAPHVWFVAFSKTVAVAVVVENGGDLRHEATGGRVAGPIAKAVLEWVIRDQRKSE